MFCNNCGTRIDDGSRFCPECGSPTAAGQAAGQTPADGRPRVDETMAMPQAAQGQRQQQGWQGAPQYQQQGPAGMPQQQPSHARQYSQPARRRGLPLPAIIAIAVVVVALVGGGIGFAVMNRGSGADTTQGESSSGHGSSHGHGSSGSISDLIPSGGDSGDSSDSTDSGGSSDSGSSTDSGGSSTDSGGSSGGSSGSTTAPDGDYVVTGIIVVMDSDSLAESDGIDPSMFDSSEMYAILLLDEPVEMQLQGGDGTGLREAEPVSIICVGKSSAGTYDQWEPYSHTSDHITVAIDPYTTYWPSDVSLPVGQPRTSTARVVS